MSSNTDFVLAIEDLTVSFDGFKAVDSLNLYIEPNELRVIIGPNGAGKTTVLDLITGRTKPTSGSIKFKNREMIGMSEHQIVRSGRGRKWHTPSIYENLTVFENLEVSYPKGRSVLGCLAFRRTPEVVERIQRVAQEIGLQEELETLGATLSHGQKQWLEIGMLLMQDPILLILDEPVAGMSPAEREQTAALIQKISQGRSIIIIEHDMEFVSRIAHKVTVLHLGRILAEGSMESIQRNPDVVNVYLGH